MKIALVAFIVACFCSTLQAQQPSNVAQERFFLPKDTLWGYAQFDYDPGSASYSADKAGTPSCGDVCHVKVKGKDYVFHPYQMR